MSTNNALLFGCEFWGSGSRSLGMKFPQNIEFWHLYTSESLRSTIQPQRHGFTQTVSHWTRLAFPPFTRNPCFKAPMCTSNVVQTVSWMACHEASAISVMLFKALGLGKTMENCFDLLALGPTGGSWRKCGIKVSKCCGHCSWRVPRQMKIHSSSVPAVEHWAIGCDMWQAGCQSTWRQGCWVKHFSGWWWLVF